MLKAVLASLDGLDESLKQFYRADDSGRFVLQVEGVDDLPAVAGLRKKNSELLAEKKSIAEKLEAFGDITPEQITEWKKGAKGTGKEAERIAELEQKLEQQAKAARAEVEAERRKAQEAISAAESYFLRSEISRAAQSHRASPALLEHELRRHLKVRRNSAGEFEAVVIGPDGQPRIKDSQGNPYTVDDLVASYRDHPDFGRAFDARKGSDAPPGGGNGGAGGAGTFNRHDPMVWGQYAEAVVTGKATAA